jgi:hypothetical protein
LRPLEIFGRNFGHLATLWSSLDLYGVYSPPFNRFSLHITREGRCKNGEEKVFRNRSGIIRSVRLTHAQCRETLLAKYFSEFEAPI